MSRSISPYLNNKDYLLLAGLLVEVYEFGVGEERHLALFVVAQEHLLLYYAGDQVAVLALLDTRTLFLDCCYG